MIVLLMTAVLSAAATDRQALTDTPPLIANPYHCREVAEKVRDQQRAEPHKLGTLPPAQAEWAVMRKVEGCMVAVPMKAYRPGLKIIPAPQD